MDNDRELTAPSSLPRTQFNDHIPELLDAFEKRLHVWPRSESAASEQQRKEDAASHGLQRWQQGYRLREVTREWGHLHLCLVDELESYSTAHPDLEPGVMPTAWRALAELCSQGVSESTTQYFQLEKVEAAGHVRDMEQTLEEVRRTGAPAYGTFPAGRSRLARQCGSSQERHHRSHPGCRPGDDAGRVSGPA